MDEDLWVAFWNVTEEYQECQAVNLSLSHEQRLMFSHNDQLEMTVPDAYIIAYPSICYYRISSVILIPPVSISDNLSFSHSGFLT